MNLAYLDPNSNGLADGWGMEVRQRKNVVDGVSGEPESTATEGNLATPKLAVPDEGTTSHVALLLICCLGFALRAYTASTSPAPLHPDALYQSLEIAHLWR